MTRISVKVILFVLLLVSSFVEAATNFLAADASTPVVDDIPYRAALYYQHSGEFDKGLAVLAAANPATASAPVQAWRDMLNGYIYLQKGYYEDAERLLSALNNSQIFPVYNAQVLYPLVKAYFGESRCDKVLSTLAKAQGFPPEINAQITFMRVSCMVGQSKDPAIISQAESVINEALLTQRKIDRMWFAYTYFNVASAAAGSFANYYDADRLYNEALKYINLSSEEGKALKQKTLLNMGLANYQDNRFDYAAKYFAQMPLDGLWSDISLLAYGWANFRSYKPDIAIEAWRQLVNLPYRSMSVYEGFMDIPSAYEQANDFGDALKAYDDALNEFIKAMAEIQQTKKTLNVKTVHDYAVQYAKSMKDSTAINLPPLLARTYTEDRQIELVRYINDIEMYKKRLADYSKRLQALKSKGSAVSVLQRNVSALQVQAGRLQKAAEAKLLSRTLAVLDTQYKRIAQFALDARVTNVRLQEEYFQRGGRKLWH